MSRRELRDRRSDLAQWLIELERMKPLQHKLQPSTYAYIMKDELLYRNEIESINKRLNIT